MYIRAAEPMAFSVFFAMLTMERWSLPMDLKGWLYLFSAMLSFCVAGGWGYYQVFKNKEISVSSSRHRQVLKSNNLVMFVLLFLVVVMAYFSYKEVYDLSVFLGNQDGPMNMIRTIRPAIEAQEVSMSRWMSYRMLFAQMVAYVYLYVFLANFFGAGFRLGSLKLLLPVVAYLPFVILTTGRMEFLIFLIYMFIVAAILYQKNEGYTLRGSKKLIISLSAGVVAFIGLFLLMGYFTGKTVTEDRTPFVILSHYAGVSIPAFSAAVEYPVLEDGYIGSHTLLGVYRVLEKFGILNNGIDIFLPFIDFDGIDTNIYTAEWRYYLDYGFTGMLVIMGIMGLGYTLLYNFLKFYSKHDFFILWYAVVSFPLFLSTLDEKLLMYLVGTPILYQTVMLFIVYKIVTMSCKKEEIC